jgi:hypothetical protein
MRLPQRRQDHLLHALDIVENIVVPKPDDTPAALLQPRRPPVVLFVISMLPAIGFNDEPTLEADEIDDEPTQAMLTTEFESAQAAIAEHAPQATFGVG